MFKNKVKVKKFDLIFSLGAACPCSETLRRNYLQVCSFPLDWVAGSTFSNQIDFLLNNFERYFEKEDLEFVSDDNGSFDSRCNVYKNNFNQLIFNHDLIHDIDFNKAYTIAKEKYDRRIARLYEKINEAKDILIVYIQAPHTNSQPDNPNLEETINKINSKYPDKNFNILYLVYDSSMQPQNYKIEEINDKLTKIIGNHKATKPNAPDYAINGKMLSKILKNYSLKLPFGYKIKTRLIKLIIKTLPNRKLRQKLRKKFHIM
ncbi:hypothetical protein IJ425_06985 [bacterium]|nr:hypothetical protein [bacterium]